jgi:hypothetical protein
LRPGRGAGDLVSLGVHALSVRNIVAFLKLMPGGSAGVASNLGPADEAGRAADYGAGAGVPGGRANRRAQRRPCRRSHNSAGGEVLIGGLTRRRPADLRLSPLPACSIIGLEYLERLSRAGKRSYAGACRHGCASRDHGYDG